MNWKLLGLAAFVNAILTAILTLIYVPLSFIGPIIGGFLASYLSKGYEDYSVLDWKDGAVVGAISGLVGGLILTLLFIGLGTWTATLESFTGDNLILMYYVILQITVIISFILGLVGGVLGVTIKR